MAGRHFLFVPGPTNVPDRVTARHDGADGGPSVFEISRTHAALFQDLKKVYKTTDGQVFIFPVVRHRRLGGLASPTRCRPATRF